MTLDGKIAAHTGDSRWVTGEAARRHVHETRNRLLRASWSASARCLRTIRCSPAASTADANPIRIVCDSRARMPIDSQTCTARRAKSPTYIAVVESKRAHGGRWNRRGVTHSRYARTKNGRVDLADLMRQLGALGIDGRASRRRLGTCVLRRWRPVWCTACRRTSRPKIIGGAGAKSPVGGAGI